MSSVAQLRQEKFARDLFQVWKGEIEVAEHKNYASALSELNDRLFAELDRLSSMEMDDVDSVKMELSRAKATADLAKVIIDSSSTIVDVVRLRMQYQGQERIPPALGEGE